MKKKVLLLAIATLLLTVFDSVPVYAQSAEVEVREEKEVLETGAEASAVSAGAVAMATDGQQAAVNGTSEEKEQQDTKTEAEEKEKEEKNSENDKKDDNDKKDGKDSKEKTDDKKDEKDSKEKEDKKEKKDEKDKKDGKDEKKDKKDKDDKKGEKDSKEKKDEKKEKSYSKADIKLLACLIYSEAGNQSYKGKLAVGNVVMNRVKSNLFPNNLEDVIYQSGYSSSYGRRIYQFSVASPSVGTLKKALGAYGKRKSAIELQMEEECIKAAKAALEGKSAFDGKNYLFFCRYSSSLASRRSGIKLGAHYFYK